MHCKRSVFPSPNLFTYSMLDFPLGFSDVVFWVGTCYLVNPMDVQLRKSLILNSCFVEALGKVFLFSSYLQKPQSPHLLVVSFPAKYLLFRCPCVCFRHNLWGGDTLFSYNSSSSISLMSEKWSTRSNSVLVSGIDHSGYLLGGV